MITPPPPTTKTKKHNTGSPVKWPGSKRLLAKYIVPLIPEHDAYVEVFGGSLAILRAKGKSKCEVINDIDGDLINFYRVAKWHAQPLMDELKFSMHSRDEFRKCITQPGITDIQRAARWALSNRMSFGGRGETYGYGKLRGAASLKNFVDAVGVLSDRLDAVFIENLPWQEIFKRYDHAGAFFFLDPPYTTGDQTLYSTRFGVADHEDLRAELGKLKGRWVLTYDESPMIRELYHGCEIREVVRRKGIDNRQGASRVMTELIIRRKP